MKKISILSTSVFLIVFLCINILNLKAQPDNSKIQKSLVIQFKNDKSVKRVEVAFTHSLTLDSLIRIKKELQAIGITVNYKKIEFDVHNLLSNLDCEVICNDGFSGSFGTGILSSQNRDRRIGFYRDYSPNSNSPFATGLLDNK